MLIIHAVQKLLNLSRIQASMYVTQPAPGQLMHSWYAKLLPSVYPGKLFVIYVHEPSLLSVVCRGKTIKGTWPEFRERLPNLMKRFNFPPALIESEIKEAETYVVSKTSSKSMLAHMNQLVYQFEYSVTLFPSYDLVSQDYLENEIMKYPYQSSEKGEPYTTAKQYWERKISIM